MHGHGDVHKKHSVSYSIGLAGKYHLHVRLRSEGLPLPGSPYELQVCPGDAHGHSSFLITDDQLVTGKKAGVVLRTCDVVGNACTVGGANVSCACPESPTVIFDVTDREDGTYVVEWRAPRGRFMIHIMINEMDVIGSPLAFEGGHGAPSSSLSQAPAGTTFRGTSSGLYKGELTVPIDPVRHTRRRMSMGVSGMRLPLDGFVVYNPEPQEAYQDVDTSATRIQATVRGRRARARKKWGQLNAADSTMDSIMKQVSGASSAVAAFAPLRNGLNSLFGMFHPASSSPSAELTSDVPDAEVIKPSTPDASVDERTSLAKMVEEPDDAHAQHAMAGASAETKELGHDAQGEPLGDGTPSHINALQLALSSCVANLPKCPMSVSDCPPIKLDEVSRSAAASFRAISESTKATISALLTRAREATAEVMANATRHTIARATLLSDQMARRFREVEMPCISTSLMHSTSSPAPSTPATSAPEELTGSSSESPLAASTAVAASEPPKQQSPSPALASAIFHAASSVTSASTAISEPVLRDSGHTPTLSSTSAAPSLTSASIDTSALPSGPSLPACKSHAAHAATPDHGSSIEASISQMRPVELETRPMITPLPIATTEPQVDVVGQLLHA